MEAFRLAKHGANLGLARSLAQLGQCHFNGYGTVIDKKTAILHCWQPAAERQDPWALFWLGEQYAQGLAGVLEQDFKKAFTYYQKSADLLDIDAVFHVARCYQKGEGVEKDFAKAIEYYQKASKMGCKKAAKILQMSINLFVTD